MQSAAIVLFGFVLLVAQSTFAHMTPWDMAVPNASLAVVLYMGLHDYNVSKGVLISFVLGYLMDVFAGNPRFILNSGCALPPATPSENVEAMIRVARLR